MPHIGAPCVLVWLAFRAPGTAPHSPDGALSAGRAPPFGSVGAWSRMPSWSRTPLSSGSTSSAARGRSRTDTRRLRSPSGAAVACLPTCASRWRGPTSRATRSARSRGRAASSRPRSATTSPGRSRGRGRGGCPGTRGSTPTPCCAISWTRSASGSGEFVGCSSTRTSMSIARAPRAPASASTARTRC